MCRQTAQCPALYAAKIFRSVPCKPYFAEAAHVLIAQFVSVIEGNITCVCFSVGPVCGSMVRQPVMRRCIVILSPLSNSNRKNFPRRIKAAMCCPVTPSINCSGVGAAMTCALCICTPVIVFLSKCGSSTRRTVSTSGNSGIQSPLLCRFFDLAVVKIVDDYGRSLKRAAHGVVVGHIVQPDLFCVFAHFPVQPLPIPVVAARVYVAV